MKINLKITFNQLTEIIKAIQQDRIIQPAVTLSEKANDYLFNSAFKKLLRKQIDKSDSNSLKKFNVALSYPEAVALWQNLQNVNINDNYRLSVWVVVTGSLHQKLQ